MADRKLPKPMPSRPVLKPPRIEDIAMVHVRHAFITMWTGKLSDAYNEATFEAEGQTWPCKDFLAFTDVLQAHESQNWDDHRQSYQDRLRERMEEAAETQALARHVLDLRAFAQVKSRIITEALSGPAKMLPANSKALVEISAAMDRKGSYASAEALDRALPETKVERTELKPHERAALDRFEQEFFLGPEEDDDDS